MDDYSENGGSILILVKACRMAGFQHRKLEKLIMLQEKLNTQIRDVCLAILIKKNSHFRFRSLFSLKVQSNSMEDVAQTIFLVFFFLSKKRESLYSSFQREIP